MQPRHTRFSQNYLQCSAQNIRVLAINHSIIRKKVAELTVRRVRETCHVDTSDSLTGAREEGVAKKIQAKVSKKRRSESMSCGRPSKLIECIGKFSFVYTSSATNSLGSLSLARHATTLDVYGSIQYESSKQVLKITAHHIRGTHGTDHSDTVADVLNKGVFHMPRSRPIFLDQILKLGYWRCFHRTYGLFSRNLVALAPPPIIRKFVHKNDHWSTQWRNSTRVKLAKR